MEFRTNICYTYLGNLYALTTNFRIGLERLWEIHAETFIKQFKKNWKKSNGLSMQPMHISKPAQKKETKVSFTMGKRGERKYIVKQSL